MMICAKCREEMSCSRTGVLVVWEGGHAYAGDEYQCRSCEARAIMTGPQPFHAHAERLRAAEERDRLLSMPS